MKRVCVYAKRICIEDGPVYHSRPGQDSNNLIPNSNTSEYSYSLDTSIMVPEEKFSLMAAGKVRVYTLTEDEDGEFYDLGESLVTDKLFNLYVRQFLVGPVNNFDQEVKNMGFVKLDLEF